ncbi:MAG: hypothetical protein ACKOF7_02295, partial [Phycisphaerales bacterium]
MRAMIASSLAATALAACAGLSGRTAPEPVTRPHEAELATPGEEPAPEPAVVAQAAPEVAPAPTPEPAAAPEPA